MTAPIFTKQDAGCWIDGAHGYEHAREKMLGLLDRVDSRAAHTFRTEFQDVTAHLNGLGADYLLNEATDVLQEHTAPGLVWWWEAGDLVLTTDDEYHTR